MNACKVSGELFSRPTTSAASWFAISNGVMKGCWACWSRDDERPSRKNPPVGVPASRKNPGVSDAYINDGVLRNPGISLLGPPSGTGSPWSVAGSAVKAREATWQVAHDCRPETERLWSLKRAFPAVAASDNPPSLVGCPPDELPLSPPPPHPASTPHTMPAQAPLKRNPLFFNAINHPSRPRPVRLGRWHTNANHS